jgi:hypothetical protein
MEIFFAQPKTIDSSHIIIYPLILERVSSSGSLSSGYSERTNYWNLIFYNTETGFKNLLTNDKKILITSIEEGNSFSSEFNTELFNIINNSIFYNVVTSDFNQNKQLDQEDLTYLFISDKQGKNFRQISPADYNIQSWEVIKGTNKVIMQAQRDDNNDKKFNENDRSTPFIVDLSSSGSAIQTFSNSYIDTLKSTLIHNWKTGK